MIVEIRGNFSTRQVLLNRKPLSPDRSLKVRNHSPDGFAWGYSGSGPAQLALAIMLEFYPRDKAERLYQKFKEAVVAHLPQQDFEFVFDLDAWAEEEDK